MDVHKSHINDKVRESLVMTVAVLVWHCTYMHFCELSSFTYEYEYIYIFTFTLGFYMMNTRVTYMYFLR